MMIKKMGKIVNILSTMIIFAIIFWLGVQQGKLSRIIELNERQELMLQAHDKQIPFIEQYIKIVKELSEAARGKLTPWETTEIARIIVTQCNLNQDIGITPATVMALIERESGFNPTLISHAKAYGLTQCLYSTFSFHMPNLGYGLPTEKTMLDPVINVETGMAELVRLKKIWLSEGIETREDWKITFYSYYSGERWTRLLLSTLKKTQFPGLEYGIGTSKLVEKWKGKGL